MATQCNSREAKFNPKVYIVQVRSLYGPLLACVTASKSAFEAMVRQHSPDGTSKTFVELIREHPEGREGQIYRQAPLCSLFRPHDIAVCMHNCHVLHLVMTAERLWPKAPVLTVSSLRECLQRGQLVHPLMCFKTDRRDLVQAVDEGGTAAAE